MRKLITILCTGLILCSGFTGLVFADTFEVSCYIPAIPGVNVPLLEDTSQKELTPKEQTTTDQDDEQKNDLIAEEQTDKTIVLVKTFYDK